jgi:hypothetical protein
LTNEYTGTIHKVVLENGFHKTGIIPPIRQPVNAENLIQFVIKYYDDNNL